MVLKNINITPGACRVLQKAYSAEQIQRCHTVLMIPSKHKKYSREPSGFLFPAIIDNIRTVHYLLYIPRYKNQSP